MGKWFNWMMWGITYPMLGAILALIPTFFSIDILGTVWPPQFVSLVITPKVIASAGMTGAIAFLMTTIGFSVVFWLLAGVVSLVTTPMLSRARFGGSASLIFVPWLVLASADLLLNLGATATSPNFIADMTALLTGFVASVIVNYVFIWVSVWINRLFRMQRYLPA